jgi:hypothetical protein
MGVILTGVILLTIVILLIVILLRVIYINGILLFGIIQNANAQFHPAEPKKSDKCCSEESHGIIAKCRFITLLFLCRSPAQTGPALVPACPVWPLFWPPPAWSE